MQTCKIFRVLPGAFYGVGRDADFGSQYPQHFGIADIDSFSKENLEQAIVQGIKNRAALFLGSLSKQ